VEVQYSNSASSMPILLLLVYYIMHVNAWRVLILRQFLECCPGKDLKKCQTMHEDVYLFL
jgi:hypothetical protein